MENNFSYDELGDSLMISNKEKGEVVKKNFMLDDFVISTTGRGKIVSLEIKNVSSVLKEMGINPHILDDLENANLKIIPKLDTVFIGVSLKQENIVSPTQFPITHLPMECLN